MSYNNCPICTTRLVILPIGGKNRQSCQNCDFVNWDNPKPVTAVIVPMNSGIVLVKRKYEPFIGDWCLPGGFMEANESPIEGAIREVYEETGLNIEIDQLIEVTSPGRNINVIILFYLSKIATGNPIAGDDASEVNCFKHNELPVNIAFDLHKRLIDNYLAKIKVY